jgi:hypothetical protein
MSAWRQRWQQAYRERRALNEHWGRERLRLHYYESGHAAGHAAFGVPVLRVGVRGTGPEMSGRCFWRANRPIDYWALTVCALAGSISDEIFFDVEPNRSAEDWTHAREFAAKVDASNIDAVIEQAHRYAGDLIHRNARAVEQLALRHRFIISHPNKAQISQVWFGCLYSGITSLPFTKVRCFFVIA